MTGGGIVGRMLGASWAGAGKAQGHQQGGLVFPFLEKALEGDRRGQIFVPLITTAAGGLAGSLVDALRALGEPSPVSTQTHVCCPSRGHLRSHFQECFDFIEAGGQWIEPKGSADVRKGSPGLHLRGCPLAASRPRGCLCVHHLHGSTPHVCTAAHVYIVPDFVGVLRSTSLHFLKIWLHFSCSQILKS